MVDALDNYYLLGFYPSDPKGSAFRPITVTANRPGLTVRYRRGYVPAAKSRTPKRTDPVGELYAGVLPRTDLPVRVFAAALPTGSRNARVVVTTEIAVPRDRVTRADGRLSDAVHHAVLAGDMNVGKVKKEIRRTVEVVSRTAGGGDASGALRYQINTDLMLPPGRYQIRASALSDALKQGGSAYLPLEVPDFGKSRVASSGWLIGYASGARAAGERAPAGLPFQPTLDRVFSGADVLRAYFELARKNREDTPAAVVEILDGSDRIVTSRAPLAESIDGRRSRVDLEVPLRDLASGPHRLRATVTSGGESVTREIGFVVNAGASRRH